MSVTSGQSQSFNVPIRPNAPPLELGRYLVAKATLEFAYSRTLIEDAPPPRGANGAPPDPHASRTTAGAALSPGGAGISASTKRQVAEGIFDEFKAGISTATALSVIDSVAATDSPATNSSLFDPLFSGFAATRTNRNVAVSLSYDSQLCFVAGIYSFPHEIAGTTFTVTATFRVGLSGEAYLRLMTKLFSDSGRVANGVRRLRAFLSGPVGATTARRLASCGRLLRFFAPLAPFIWAIDIACFLRDLALISMRAAAAAGHRRGQLMTFAGTFTRCMFHEVNNRVGDPQHMYPEYQTYAYRLAVRFNSDERAALRSLLTYHFGEEPAGGEAIWYARTTHDVQRVGIAFGQYLYRNYEPPRAGSGRRESTLETIRNIREFEPQLDIRVAGFFASRVEPWLESWERE